ncbi:hypothetical protein GW17_00012284, partial [Ensete ventricosum]
GTARSPEHAWAVAPAVNHRARGLRDGLLPLSSLAVIDVAVPQHDLLASPLMMTGDPLLMHALGISYCPTTKPHPRVFTTLLWGARVCGGRRVQQSA